MSRRFLAPFFIVAAIAATLIATRATNSVAEDSAANSSAPSTQKSARFSPADGPADLVLTNAQIETMDPAHEWAGAVAIRGESIVAVSYITAVLRENQQAFDANAAEIKPWIGASTRVIDLHGAFAMPGFNDAHVH